MSRLQRLRLQRLPLRRLRRHFYRRLWWLWFRRLLPIVGLLPFLLIRGAPCWDIDKRDEDWLQGGERAGERTRRATTGAFVSMRQLDAFVFAEPRLQTLFVHALLSWP